MSKNSIKICDGSNSRPIYYTEREITLQARKLDFFHSVCYINKNYPFQNMLGQLRPCDDLK